MKFEWNEQHQRFDVYCKDETTSTASVRMFKGHWKLYCTMDHPWNLVRDELIKNNQIPQEILDSKAYFKTFKEAKCFIETYLDC